jgi:hypothetical protein
MAKKRKKRKIAPEYETYEIEPEDWGVAYDFGLNRLSRGIVRGVYWEHSTLILTGKIVTPVLKITSKAKIVIIADSQLDDHWKEKPTITSAKSIGWIQILRDEDKTLFFSCSIPSQSMPNLAVASNSGKIKFISIYGTKLKWGNGTILSIDLFTQHEED